LKKRFLEAGIITGTHGIRGEVKIKPYVDSADFLKQIPALYIDGTPYKPVSPRVHKSMLITALGGIEGVNAAMPLKGKTVFFDRDDVTLEPGAFYIGDILGARVCTESGAEIGVLSDVIEAPSANVYVVSGETEHLIPAVDEFILNTDAENGLITVHLIEGM